MKVAPWVCPWSERTTISYGPGRVGPCPRDAVELLIELAQRFEGVGALEAGVVGDLVVAREGGVHRGAPAHHVREDPEHDEVADDDAHRRAHQRIDAAAMAARAHVASCGAGGSRQLQHDLPPEQHERARDVEPVGQERAIAGVRPALRVRAAHREDRLVGLARQEVAAARSAVDQQPDAGGVTSLDLGAV